MTLAQIKGHPGPLRSGRMRLVRLHDRWVPGGLPERLRDTRAFARLYGLTAEEVRRKFPDVSA